jgi:hypothetical protein
MEYGTGAIMAVPAHDQRDFDFARKYDIPIRVVIDQPGSALDGDTMTEAFTGEGMMVNSGKFNGLSVEEGKKAVIKFMEANDIGKELLTTSFGTGLFHGRDTGVLLFLSSTAQTAVRCRSRSRTCQSTCLKTLNSGRPENLL